jgi:cytochrome b6-f complex iron-sulfur subunit
MTDDRGRGDRGATLFTRRDALTRSGWALVGSSGAIATGGAVRLLFPRVHRDPPTQVTLCKPDELAVGEVSERWKSTHGLVLVRSAEGLYALRATCTHLGCVPRWSGAEDKFRCPCHGSGFHRDGVEFEGPAPRALERLAIGLDGEGRVVVDTAIRLRRERGEWDRPGALLRLPAEAKRDVPA